MSPKQRPEAQGTTGQASTHSVQQLHQLPRLLEDQEVKANSKTYVRRNGRCILAPGSLPFQVCPGADFQASFQYPITMRAGQQWHAASTGCSYWRMTCTLTQVIAWWQGQTVLIISWTPLYRKIAGICPCSHSPHHISARVAAVLRYTVNICFALAMQTSNCFMVLISRQPAGALLTAAVRGIPN